MSTPLRSLNWVTPRRNRGTLSTSKVMSARRRKSLRTQQSLSLNLPLNTTFNLNPYISIPDQLFSLTFLGADGTQNPDSLSCLEELKKKKWDVYLVGYLFNFSYKPEKLKAISKALDVALSSELQTCGTGMTYRSRVSVTEDFSPTDNDSSAIVIEVTGEREGKVTLVYKGYLLSWCSPMKANITLLPVLLSWGSKKHRPRIHSVLSEKLGVMITKLELTQEDFLHLSTYCLVMLDENDNYPVTFQYRISTGAIKFIVSFEYLWKLWKKIHKSDSTDVDLDEILLFHEALESFFESTFGIKLGLANFEKVVVVNFFTIERNKQMWFSSTKIIHVVLKYLNYLAVKRLKVEALNFE